VARTSAAETKHGRFWKAESMTDTLVPVTLIEHPFDGIVPGSQEDRCIQAHVRLPGAAVLAVIAARLDTMEGGKSSTGEVLKPRRPHPRSCFF
jgi:hypothetical protein